MAFVYLCGFFAGVGITFFSSCSTQKAEPKPENWLRKTGEVALQSVFRIIRKDGKTGTCFLHSSGKLITAAHVVQDVQPLDIMVILPTGGSVVITQAVYNSALDLAILYPSMPVKAPSLRINPFEQPVELGSRVATWGFSGGYGSKQALLCVGYLAGVDVVPTTNGPVARLVVNAAFNGGNSGGPLINLETGNVIGVVSSKVAPIPEKTIQELAALKKQKFGFQYSATINGTTNKVAEGAIIADVLDFLRSQTQLVIGHSPTQQDLYQFLKSIGIEK